MNKLVSNELDLYQDYQRICGVDEAGRGPLAGPLVCSAVIFDLEAISMLDEPDVNYLLTNLNDSKKLTETKREILYPIIIKYALTYSITEISNQEIDRLNILKATLTGMDQALESLQKPWDIALIDGNKLPPRHQDKSKYVIKGDSTYFSIAGASVLAKVTRDRIMKILHTEYPQYNWLKNKGYPTKEHLKAISEYGITDYHRLSYGPCSQMTLPGF